MPVGVLLLLLLLPAFVNVTPAEAAPNVTSTSTFEWHEPLGASTVVHLGGEVTNNDASNPAGLIEVNYELLAGASDLGPETAYVWEMGADILAPLQTTPYEDTFVAPPGYTSAVLQSVTATDPLTPPDHAFTVSLHPCPDMVDVNHVCGTVTNNNTATVDSVRAVLTFYYTDGGGHTSTVDEDVAPLNNNPMDSLDPGASADFELVRSSLSPLWNGTPAVFAESTTTVPGAPTEVSAVPGNHSATVSWNEPIDGGHMITGYTVTADPGGATAAVDGNTTSTVISGLSNGTSYRFSVTATNPVGTGFASAPSDPVIPATIPDRPTGVTASLSHNDVHTAIISWTAPFDEGRQITSYTVTASSGGLTATVTGSPASTTASISGLVTNTSYTFTVTATNALGTSAASDPSNSVTPMVLPPTAIRAAAPSAPATPFRRRGGS